MESGSRKEEKQNCALTSTGLLMEGVGQDFGNDFQD
jgi:hypothetical protein